ncbi:MAG: hypothetical protein IPN70_00345 [Candidatus Moraniibacteriota bacterium]|nr:MAG: hypothetical protein IPN70_00345 [Candidatus Moranbacteria bacterium]
MNEEELTQKLDAIEKKIDIIEQEVHKVRKHLMTRFIISLILFVLPIIAIAFSVPFLLDFISSYPMDIYQELNWK